MSLTASLRVKMSKSVVRDVGLEGGFHRPTEPDDCCVGSLGSVTSCVLVSDRNEMFLQSPRRMCAPFHKRLPFPSRMRWARTSARPRIFGVKINKCTTIFANLVRKGSSEKRIAPFKMERWL